MKEKSKLTKRKDKEKLDTKASYYTEQIIKAKNNYTLRMTNALNDPEVAP